MTGSGGWPMSVFLTPDRRPFFGGTYFPPGGPPRHARRSGPCWRPSPTSGTTDGPRWRSRPTSWPRPSPPARCWRPTPTGTSRRSAGAPAATATGPISWPPPSPSWPSGSTRVGRVRPRPQVPPADLGGPRPVPTPGATGPGDDEAAADGHHHPGRHGRRRHPRPPGRRLRPLLDGPRVAGPPLREDALRPGRPAPRLPPRLAGDRARRLPRGGRGHRRPTWPGPGRPGGRRCPRPRTPTPRGWRGGSTSGPPTRWRRRSGPAAPRRRGGGRRRRRLVRGHPGRQLRGQHHPPPSARGPAGRRGRRRGGPAAPVRGPGHRVRPGLDDKVLTEWNAMYGSALAEAAAATGDRGLGGRRRSGWPSSSAPTCVGPTTAGGCGAGSPAAVPATWPTPPTTPGWSTAFTRLAELTGGPGGPSGPSATADALLDLFHDDEGGGFFTTGHDAEALIVRTKDVLDGATPSANAVAALALARLGALTGEDRYADAAREVVGPARGPAGPAPDRLRPHPARRRLLCGGGTEVVVTGDRPDLVGVVQRHGCPRRSWPGVSRPPRPCGQGRDGDRAYVCRDYACRCPPPTRPPWPPSWRGTPTDAPTPTGHRWCRPGRAPASTGAASPGDAPDRRRRPGPGRTGRRRRGRHPAAAPPGTSPAPSSHGRASRWPAARR